MNIESVSTIIVLGNDKIGSRALALDELCYEGVEVYLDCSSSYRRVWKLICKGSLSIALILKMGLAELARSKSPRKVKVQGSIKSNGELIKLINDKQPDRIVFFRAGLIVSKKAIECGVPLLNIHCAKLPDYGGLGSIERAISDGMLAQCATLHKITESIDRGEVFDSEPYELDDSFSYGQNEERAYDAGIALMKRVIHRYNGATGVQPC